MSSGAGDVPPRRGSRPRLLHVGRVPPPDPAGDVTMAHRSHDRRQAIAAIGGAAAFPFLRAVAAGAPAPAARPHLALFVSGGWFPAWSYEAPATGPSSLVLGPSPAPLARWTDRMRTLRGLVDRPALERADPQNAHEGIGRWPTSGRCGSVGDRERGPHRRPGAFRPALDRAAGGSAALSTTLASSAWGRGSSTHTCGWTGVNRRGCPATRGPNRARVPLKTFLSAARRSACGAPVGASGDPPMRHPS